jgi:hypothetical protein
MYIKAHIGHALCKRAFQQSVCIVLYKCSIISFRTAPGAARQSFVHRMAWPAGWREERTQPFHPQYRTSFLSPSPREAPRIPHSCTCIQYSYNAKRREREPASQPNMQIPPIHRTHIPNPHRLPLPLHNPIPFHSIATQISYIPPAPFCTCVKYCLLVVFHAAMYFSMQLV